MSPVALIVIALAFAAIAIGVLLLMPKQSGVRQMMGTMSKSSVSMKSAQDREFERAKEILAKRSKKSKVKPTLREKFFQAGLFTPRAQTQYYNRQKIAPVVGAIALGYGGFMADATLGMVGIVFGFLLGLQFPTSWLDRKILARGEDIMYYLPLVIEQISIGVSSSLDIGPVLQRVVTMAEERDSHNVVTELLRIVVTLARSGISLEDALIEVGRQSGHLELKQTFGALAQVTRHGGEITRQLQELADAVASQRETKIEAKIKKLELEATGPVALVFLGFFLILLTCIGLQLGAAFV